MTALLITAAFGLVAVSTWRGRLDAELPEPADTPPQRLPGQIIRHRMHHSPGVLVWPARDDDRLLGAFAEERDDLTPPAEPVVAEPATEPAPVEPVAPEEGSDAWWTAERDRLRTELAAATRRCNTRIGNHVRRLPHGREFLAEMRRYRPATLTPAEEAQFRAMVAYTMATGEVATVGAGAR